MDETVFFIRIPEGFDDLNILACTTRSAQAIETFRFDISVRAACLIRRMQPSKELLFLAEFLAPRSENVEFTRAAGCFVAPAITGRDLRSKNPRAETDVFARLLRAPEF